VLRRFGLVLLLIAALVAATTLVACGGDDEESGGDATQLLQETFSSGKKITSGNLDVKIDVDMKTAQGEQAITVGLKGPFQTTGDGKLPKFDLDLDVGIQGRTTTLGAISTGTAGYVEFQGQAYSLSPEVFNQFSQGFADEEKRDTNQTSLSALGIKPINWITDPTTDGTEDVMGVETEKITGQINLDALLGDVNKVLQRASSTQLGQSRQRIKPLSPTTIEQIKIAVKEARIQINTGSDDKILRKIVLDIDVEIPEIARPQLRGLESAKGSVSIQIGDVNQPQDITAPANAKPLDDLIQQFQGLGLPGTGGTGPSGPSGPSLPQPPPGGPQAETAQEYAKCLQEAGGDVTKAQRCADILTR
jgi:hypothetical protein